MYFRKCERHLTARLRFASLAMTGRFQRRDEIKQLLLTRFCHILVSLRGALVTKQSQETTQLDRQYYIYIMTNKKNTVIYIGVTNDLKRRVYEHREKLAEGFTKKYKISKLVYYEVFEDVENAILREKQIKGGSRQKKIELVNSMNKEWRDLYEEL